NIKSMIGTDIPEINALVYGWMLPGVIAVATFTLALGNMGRLVDDAKDESLSDFLVSPVKRSQLILSYLVATIFISFVISMMMFVLSIFIVKLKGGPYLDFNQIITSIGIIILLIISSSLMALIIASFIKSQNTYGVVNSIVGTFIGFVTGAYMPMGIMPVVIQDIFNSLPVSQGASILRQIYLKPILADVFNGAPATMISEYRYMQGIDLKIFGHILSVNYMLMSIVLSIVVLFIISLMRFRVLSKRV
ncbi:MAG: ABC transporter permease, partial [Erysipelotrichaceae bacterium]